jgi:multidrug efflux pump subunit AcrA (membrane-fusion protein)
MTRQTKKKRKTWVILLVIAVLAVAAILTVPSLLASRLANPLANVRSVKATTGTIEKTVTGTGSLSAKETTVEVDVLDGLLVDLVRVEAGDNIAPGDELATFDAAGLQAAIWDAQNSLDSLDSQLNLLKGKTETQIIRAAVAGRVKQIFAAEGDLVQTVMSRSGALIMLSLDGKMTVSFKPSAAGSLAAGDLVTVTLSDKTDLDGTIRSISSDLCVVTISDRSAPIGDPVTVTLDGTVLGSGELAISQPLAITATDGQVDTIECSVGDKVSSGSRLLKLTQAPVSENYLRLYAQRLDEADRLATLVRYAQTNSLVADCAGEVLSVTLADGQPTGGQQAAFKVRTASDTRLTVNIDELDIAVLAVGQTVRITLDALPALSLAGQIVDIAEAGTIGQSGATFTVEIDVPENENLRLGMSATAVITVAKRENIVMIPLEALQESSGEQYVYVGTAVSAIGLGDKRVVTTGISNGEYVEIKTGLAAGEAVNYYYATGSSSAFPFGGGPFSRGTPAATNG